MACPSFLHSMPIRPDRPVRSFRRIVTVGAVIVLVPLVLLGCLTLGARHAGPAPREGIDRWTLHEGTRRSEAGCRYGYRVFDPTDLAGRTDVTDRAPRAAILLGHGFLRDQDTLIDLATTLAQAGYRAITLDFCNMRPWNGHHRRNADELLGLAAREGLPGRNVYAGFSAGALAALLAGADDPEALGVLTLDLVDQAGLGLAAANALAVPLRGLAGPDSACNANGNGRAAFLAKGASLQRIDGASHCEFESPTNWLCELACGDETPLPRDAQARNEAPDDARSDARQRARIIAETLRVVDALAAS